MIQKMQKPFILLTISISVILLLLIGFFERHKEYNILLSRNASLIDNLKRIVTSKKNLKGELDEKIKCIGTIKTELDHINKLAQNLETDKKMLQAKLEEEEAGREKAEETLRLTTNKMDFLGQQIAKLNEEIKVYKDEIIAIYKASGEKDTYGLKLSKKLELAKEDQIPYGRVAVASKKYNFIIVTPFDNKNNLPIGTAVEIYNGDERIALGSIKGIKNDFILVDGIINYAKDRDIKRGDLVLVQK